MTYGIKAFGFANGAHCPHAGQWVKEFDHDTHDGRGRGVFTPNPKRAMAFATMADAMAFWKRQSILHPRRADGEANRPMTALTVAIEPLEPTP